MLKCYKISGNHLNTLANSLLQIDFSLLKSRVLHAGLYARILRFSGHY